MECKKEMAARLYADIRQVIYLTNRAYGMMALLKEKDFVTCKDTGLIQDKLVRARMKFEGLKDKKTLIEEQYPLIEYLVKDIVSVSNEIIAWIETLEDYCICP